MKRMKLFIPLLSVLSISLTSCYKDPNVVNFTIHDVTDNEIHTDFQLGLLNAEYPDNFINQHKYEFNSYSNSASKSIDVTYLVNSDTNGKIKRITVDVSEEENFTKYWTFDGVNGYTSLYNLKTNTTYYYRVNAEYQTVFTSEIKSFKTTSVSMRNIDVEGVENVRDLGGYLLEDGNYSKQGLIYRSAQFNYNHSDGSALKSEPTSKGREILLNQLGIKSDIDLREKENKQGQDETAGINSSPLGNTVNYVHLPMRYGGSNIFNSESNKANIKAFFEYLSEESHYPVIFHCIRGTDRTGALAYVLEALLGTSENDLLKDYLFSNYANIGGSALTTRDIDGTSYYVYGIANSEGSSMKEKAANYLKNTIGVSQDTIDKIVNIMTN